MVSKKHILEAINKSINEKCWTITHMQEKLASFSRDEKTQMLQGRLTPLEWEDYNNLVKEYEEDIQRYQEFLDSGEISEDKIPQLLKLFDDLKERLDEDLFQYDRKIIEKYSLPTDLKIPVIDESEYVHDESVPLGEDYESRMGRSRINPVEASQIALQEDHVYFTEAESGWLSGYFLGDYQYIKNRINGNRDVLGDIMSPEDIMEMDRQFPYIKKHMDNAINKTDGLIQPTILYHAGPIDTSLIPGMHGTFKSYTSATFQERTSKAYAEEKDGYWEMVIYAPKGTKGVCGNGYHYYHNSNIGQLNQYTFEHEYLLGRNTGYTVVDIDYENHRQVVILDEP